MAFADSPEKLKQAKNDVGSQLALMECKPRFIGETNYKSSPSPFGIKMADRVSGRPLHEDISDLPMKKGIITNRNKKESIKTLIMTLWKRDDEAPTRAEEIALSNAVNLYLESLKTNRRIKPSFNSFYDFVRVDYMMILEQIQYSPSVRSIGYQM
jgi:hypothetical protein